MSTRALEHEHENKHETDHEHEHEHESTRARARAREHRSTRARASCTRARARGSQAVSASCQENDMRNLSDIFLTMRVCVRLDGSTCSEYLSVVYLPVFAILNHQSTCHGPRRGPTPAPWCTGGLPTCPGAENTRKDLRPEEMCKRKHIYT